MKHTAEASPAAMLLVGAPLGWGHVVRGCFPECRIQTVAPSLVSRRQKSAWRGLIADGRKIMVAVWEGRSAESARALAEHLGRPLYRLGPGTLSRLSGGLPGTASLSWMETPNNGLSANEAAFDTFNPSEDRPWRQASEDLANLARRLRIFSEPRMAETGPALRRILILGSEAGLEAELGLCRLALRENPGAEFFYRPSDYGILPKIVKELAASSRRRILSRQWGPWPAADQVYTVDSPEAVGAIIGGLEVTVTGRPFYAGRGLTDDRSGGIQRAKLSAADFFYLTCLRHTRHLAAPEDRIQGCLALLLALSARQGHLRLKHEPAYASGHFPPGWPEGVNGGRAETERLLALARKCLEQRRLASAAECCRRLPAEDPATPEALSILIETAQLRFDFERAFSLSLAAAKRFPNWRDGWFALSAGQHALLSGRAEDSLRLTAYCFLRHNRTVEMPFPGYENKLNEIYGRLPWQEAIVAAKTAGLHRVNLRLANSLMYGQKLTEATRIAGRRPHDENYRLLEMKLLRWQGRFDAARETAEQQLKISTNPELYNEALTLSLNFNDDWSAHLWEAAARKNIGINPFTAWTVLCKLGRLQEAFLHHARAPYFNQLKVYLRGRLHPGGLEKWPVVKRVLILPECFLGDELRFSRLYPALAQALPAESLIFGCDPRIQLLLKRSFPELEFCPIAKNQSLYQIKEPVDFNRLPGADCSRYLDNGGWELASASDLVITVMHALPRVLSDYSALDDLPDLRADPVKTAGFKNILRAQGGTDLIAGLSWRSSQIRFNRSLESFAPPQLAPLLEMDGVKWVICQYDGCTEEERSYLERNFGHKILTVPPTDQYHDVDAAAALYQALDVMVSGPTYPADLAGSLGRTTLLFAKSPALSTWARPSDGRHAFMPQVELFPGNPDRPDLTSLRLRLLDLKKSRTGS